jgi:transcriptional regulator with XRE-family HTH domain
MKRKKPEKHAKSATANITAHIGARVREIRNERGLTLKDLSAIVGVSDQQLSKAETGKNTMSATRIYELAVAFDVSPSAFFEGLPGVRT